MRTALLIGINTYEHSNIAPSLTGCLDDVDDMQEFLERTAGLDPAGITKLPGPAATAQGITIALTAAVSALKKGDELLVHFSGHGTPFPEHSIVHSAICPFDFDWSRQHAFLDDDLAAIMESLDPDARVTIFADSCHSGGLQQDFAVSAALALAPSHRLRTIPIPADVRAEMTRIGGVRGSRLPETIATLNVVLVSACALKETAAETEFALGDVNGAMTFLLLRQLTAAGGLRQTAAETVDALRTTLGERLFPQTPQLHGRLALFSSPLIV